MIIIKYGKLKTDVVWCKFNSCYAGSNACGLCKYFIEKNEKSNIIKCKNRSCK